MEQIPSGMGNIKPPNINKDIQTELAYDERTDLWNVREVSSGKIIQNYKTEDLRISIVYRSTVTQCFFLFFFHLWGDFFFK